MTNSHFSSSRAGSVDEASISTNDYQRSRARGSPSDALFFKGLAIAIAAVRKRFKTPTDRVDLLSKLQEGKDDEGKPMGRPELIAEALTQLIAGSDTTVPSEVYHLDTLARAVHLTDVSAPPALSPTTWP